MNMALGSIFSTTENIKTVKKPKKFMEIKGSRIPK
jgi:hypothetical protein